jgi:glycosyltransferase involved in cell wall biosynthesis
MNILQINTRNNKGGAAKVAYRLQQELKKLGHDSKMIVGHRKFRDIIDPDIKELRPGRFLSILNYRLGLNDFIFPTYKSYAGDSFFKNADVINFHNIHGGYFNVLALPKLTALKPSVITLHDPWLFYDSAITPEYKDIFSSITPLFQLIRNRAVEKSSITLVAPSNWIKKRAARIFPTKDIRLIRHGIDTAIFKKTDKQEARQSLDFPMNKKIIMFMASGGTKTKEKGWDYVKEMATRFKDNNQIYFLCIGGAPDQNKPFNNQVSYINYVADERLLALYYSASDVFIFPSLAEAVGLVAIEAMACGLPVVSFKTGGVPEIIIHKKTGYIANYKDAEDLYRGVDYILNLDRPKLEEMFNLSIKIARDRYELKRTAEEYLKLYENILANNYHEQI